MHFGKARYGNGKTAEIHRFADEFNSVMKTVRVRSPIARALRRITAQCQQIFNTLGLEAAQDSTRVILRLADDGQMAHHLQAAAAMNRVNDVDGFFARASARPVRNRTKARIEPLDNLDLVKEVFLAFIRLWRKELDRESQPSSSIEVS